jgi:hypothetical protein
MANFHEQYGIPIEAQTQVDGTFLDIAIDALNSGRGLQSETRDELENIQARTQTLTAEALLADETIPHDVIQNLGRISFIDTLCLISTEVVTKKDLKRIKNPDESIAEFVKYPGLLKDGIEYHRRLFRQIERE